MLNYLLMDKDLDELSLIIRLGERYFDCSLSDAEEELLRDMLGRTRLSHPAIDELRALTGFRTNVGLRSSERRLKGRVRLCVGRGGRLCRNLFAGAVYNCHAPCIGDFSACRCDDMCGICRRQVYHRPGGYNKAAGRGHERIYT